ncbi:MAG: hypothetical protein ACYDDF_09515 [Thermoplasmatota archaeon]
MDEARIAVRYPFLAAAASWIESQGPTLESLLHDPTYGRARASGRDRLLASVQEGEIAAVDPATPGEGLVLLLGYGIARMVASALADRYVIRRYALAEAVRAKTFLETEAHAVVEEIADELGVTARATDNGEFTLHFSAYLRYASILKDASWKLVNQTFDEPGQVRIPQARLARLLQEALRIRIEGELPREVSDDVTKALAPEILAVREAARVKKEEFQTEEFGELDLEALPPCMKAILGQLQTGVNAPHTARFAITSFLHTVGLDSEGIMKLFSKAPDFKEDLTRYQVEHITGKTSGTEYTPPGCQAMKTYGICYNPDSRCNAARQDGSRYVTHPLSYYRWALKERRPRPPDASKARESSSASTEQAPQPRSSVP